MKRKMTQRLVLIMSLALGISFCLAGAAMADDGDAVLGMWLTEKKDAGIKIMKCSGEYCGRLTWLKAPKNDDGSDKLDTKNPDEAKKARKMIGIMMIWGMEYKGDGKYADGRIYAPDDGKTYKAKMTLKDNDTLAVRGYVGISAFGRTTTWTRKK